MQRTGKYMLRKRIVSVVVSVMIGIGMVIPSHIVQATEAGATTEVNVDANGTLGRNSDVSIEVTKSVIGEAGKELKLKFTISSTDTKGIKIKGVYPVIDDTFPFETSNDAYKITSAGSNEDKQKSLNATYKLTARKDLTTGYHSTRFIVEYTKDAQDFYVIKTINIYFDGEDADDSDTTEDSGDEGGDDGSDTGYDDSGSDYSDYGDDGDDGSVGGSSGSTSTPKLIVTGYETNPKKVMAGSTFKMKIHVQNTSKSTAVKNAKFLIGNESGYVLPTSGSSSIFLDSIDPGKTGDLEIEMKAAADLQQKSYILVVKGDFDDGKGTSYTYTENLYLPIYQEVKLGVTDVSMTPEMLGVGSEGTLMFTISNQGKAGVYNVNVSVKDDAVEAEDIYIGNIASAGTAYATLQLTGVADNSETGTVKVVISYEDSEGTAGELEEEIACYVGKDVVMEEESDIGLEEEEVEGPNIGKIILFIFIALVVIGIIVGIVVFVQVRKKKLQKMLEEDDEVDIEDENF